MSYLVSKKTGYPNPSMKETSILNDPVILKWQDELNRVFSEMREQLEAEKNQKDEEE